jgi:ABC-2 type transport system ATP-binding protein
MMLAAVLIVQSLQKRYGTRIAVKNVSFSVASGEVYGLLGPNGAGKSTTIKMLSGLVPPDSGQVIVNGKSITTDLNQVKRAVGIVPQEIALYDDLTALENLIFFGRLYGLPGRHANERANHLLEEVGLSARAKHKVGSFSGGMKRRVNIAAGLMHSPAILYLDEPTVGIDPQSRRRILDLVKTLNRSGLTVLYTTHYMEEAQELCHRIGIIDHGTIMAEGTLAELRGIAGELTPICITVKGIPEEELLARLRKMVETVTFEDEQLTLLTREPQTTLPRVLALMARSELPVQHVEVKEPDLEAVFLRLTGRRLRD